MPRHVAIVSTGIFVPPIEVPNATLAERFKDKAPEFVEKMERNTSIRTRFYAPEDWATSDLAVKACEDALARAGVSALDVDLIILGTDSPDTITPATSVWVQDKLGAKNAGTFDVGCACASFPTALATASGLMAVNRSLKNVLVVGVYMMHKLADPDDPMVFFYGDGAGAALLQPSDEPGVLGAAFWADGSYADCWGIFAGGTKEPASAVSVAEGRNQVRMKKRSPPEVNDEGWPNLVRRVAAENELALSDIDLLVFTQVRRNTIETVMQNLELPIERAHMIMDKWGYTGSACVPMALHDAMESGRAKVGDVVVLVGSGVGFNQAGIAIKVTDAWKH